LGASWVDLDGHARRVIEPAATRAKVGLHGSQGVSVLATCHRRKPLHASSLKAKPAGDAGGDVEFRSTVNLLARNLTAADWAFGETRKPRAKRKPLAEHFDRQ
jgi:hypothetical protein